MVVADSDRSGAEGAVVCPFSAHAPNNNTHANDVVSDRKVHTPRF